MLGQLPGLSVEEASLTQLLGGVTQERVLVLVIPMGAGALHQLTLLRGLEVQRLRLFVSFIVVGGWHVFIFGSGNLILLQMTR